MKYANVLIGFVIFSAFIVAIFNIAAFVGEQHNSETYGELQDYTNRYSFVEDFSTEEGGTLNDIDDATETGEAESDTDSNFITGALEGTKLIRGVFGSIFTVTNKVAEDMGLSQSIFLKAIQGIFYITLVLAVLFMFMRFRAET